MSAYQSRQKWKVSFCESVRDAGEKFFQDLRSSCDHCHTIIVIATARNAAGSNPENLEVMINMDCFIGCAASQ
jgi:hypothetical protein